MLKKTLRAGALLYRVQSGELSESDVLVRARIVRPCADEPRAAAHLPDAAPRAAFECVVRCARRIVGTVPLWDKELVRHVYSATELGACWHSSISRALKYRHAALMRKSASAQVALTNTERILAERQAESAAADARLDFFERVLLGEADGIASNPDAALPSRRITLRSSSE